MRLCSVKKELTEITNKLGKALFCTTSTAGNDTKCKMLTGINWLTIVSIFDYLKEDEIQRKDSIPLNDKFLMTLIKLKFYVSFVLLAYCKSISRSTMIGFFWKWMDKIYTKLSFLVRWADRDMIYSIIPPIFKNKSPRLTSIIDFLQVFIKAPRNLKARSSVTVATRNTLYSKYLIHASHLDR